MATSKSPSKGWCRNVCARRSPPVAPHPSPRDGWGGDKPQAPAPAGGASSPRRRRPLPSNAPSGSPGAKGVGGARAWSFLAGPQYAGGARAVRGVSATSPVRRVRVSARAGRREQCRRGPRRGASRLVNAVGARGERGGAGRAGRRGTQRLVCPGQGTTGRRQPGEAVGCRRQGRVRDERRARRCRKGGKACGDASAVPRPHCAPRQSGPSSEGAGAGSSAFEIRRRVRPGEVPACDGRLDGNVDPARASEPLPWGVHAQDVEQELGLPACVPASPAHHRDHGGEGQEAVACGECRNAAPLVASTELPATAATSGSRMSRGEGGNPHPGRGEGPGAKARWRCGATALDNLRVSQARAKT